MIRILVARVLEAQQMICVVSFAVILIGFMFNHYDRWCTQDYKMSVTLSGVKAFISCAFRFVPIDFLSPSCPSESERTLGAHIHTAL